MDKNSLSTKVHVDFVWRADNKQDKIGKAMQVLGYNNTQLADIIGYHRNTVSDWRKGVRGKYRVPCDAPKVVRVLLEDRIKLLNLVQRMKS